MELARTTELSTQVLDYKSKDKPSNLKIEIGKQYKISRGGSVEWARIVSIRKIGDEIIIYYDISAGSIFSDRTQSTSCTLSTFKAQLLEFGQLESIELIHPDRN